MDSARSEKHFQIFCKDEYQNMIHSIIFNQLSRGANSETFVTFRNQRKSFENRSRFHRGGGALLIVKNLRSQRLKKFKKSTPTVKFSTIRCLTDRK